MTMRLFLFLLSGLLLASSANAAENGADGPPDSFAGCPEPLAAAFRAFGKDANRWAYTIRTVTRDRKGKVVEDTVARYDPSQHYDVQWTLLKKNGLEATESEVRKHRKLRAKLEKNRKTLGELLDLKQARRVENAPAAPVVLTYAMPVKVEGNDRFPADKVEVLVRIIAASRELAGIEMRLLRPVRAALVAKVKQGGVRLDFEKVHPEHGPALTRTQIDLAASIALVPVEQHTEQTHSDFKRVTPYDERFQVKLGPLKAIDF
ncbi:MAG: hypothetical protein C0502_05890 [Opitutus sp.]|nr:hypothetical protein [Opitutus sp.]